MREMGEYGLPTLESRICLNEYFAELSIMFLIVFRYDSTTGTFTMPPGGDGYYYFSVYLVIRNDEVGFFDIVINGDLLCTAYNDLQDTPGDPGPATCSATTYATQGINRPHYLYLH